MIMEKACVVLVTGAGGDAQGWGNMQVTESVREAILANGYDCRIVTAENREEMERGLNAGKCSIVWSSLYFFSTREDIIGIPPDAVWVADVLDELGISSSGESCGLGCGFSLIGVISSPLAICSSRLAIC